jgi:hypothetical protein
MNESSAIVMESVEVIQPAGIAAGACTTARMQCVAFLAPRLKHGMLIAFDDYFCWSTTQVSGERQAFLEFEATQPGWRFLRYRDYGWAGCSYLVERI